MTSTNLKRKWPLEALAIWLVLSLACNYPMATRQPAGISAEALRQTLEADGAGLSPTAGAAGQPEPPTATPGDAAALTATPPAAAALPTPGALPADGVYLYTAQPGDTLPALAGRFDVSLEQVASPQAIPSEGLIPPGQALTIPDVLGQPPYPAALLPDSEVVYSPSTLDFSIPDFIQSAGGFLASYQDRVDGEVMAGADIVERVALETSTNPRLLLAFIEYRSGWVTGHPAGAEDNDRPLGLNVPGYYGLYKELSVVGKELNIGYYGWRAGALTDIRFRQWGGARLSPSLNAGSVALQYLFSKLYKQGEWEAGLYSPGDFMALYQRMFGDAWARAARMGPLMPAGLAPPELELPFQPGERWSFTSGPHPSWNTGTPRGALDFAPVTGERGCSVSRAWVTASAAGLVARSSRNVVTIDLDGDGHEQTGWVLFYLHVADEDRIQAGVRVETDERLGHPSCEGGSSTGIHVHIARKFNGEWIPAGGPLPFVLSGWEVRPGEKNYTGTLVKDGQVVTANPGGPGTSIIVREAE